MARLAEQATECKAPLRLFLVTKALEDYTLAPFKARQTHASKRQNNLQSVANELANQIVKRLFPSQNDVEALCRMSSSMEHTTEPLKSAVSSLARVRTIDGNTYLLQAMAELIRNK